MTDEVRTELLSTIARRLTPKALKVRAHVELTCYSYEGINGIKSALRAGESVSEDLKIRLIAPPLYVMTMTSTDKGNAIEMMEKAIEKIGEEIEKHEGNLSVPMKVRTKHDWLFLVGVSSSAGSSIVSSFCYVSPLQPRVTSDQDDDALAKLMDQAERENNLVAGDSDSDADEDEE